MVYFLDHEDLLSLFVNVAGAAIKWHGEDPQGYEKCNEDEWYARIGAQTNLQSWIVSTAIAARYGKIK